MRTVPVVVAICDVDFVGSRSQRSTGTERPPAPYGSDSITSIDVIPSRQLSIRLQDVLLPICISLLRAEAQGTAPFVFQKELFMIIGKV